MNSEAQQKWDLIHLFSYSYICQPPKKYWDDEEFMYQREILFQQVAHDIHTTDWKTIYTRYSDFRPIQLAYNDAKEYFAALSDGKSTPEYDVIRGYAELVEQERKKIRAPKEDDRPLDKLRRPKR